MWGDNRFTERFGLAHPIVQGPFGGGLSSVRLTAVVSDAGGLGSFGAQQLTPDGICALVAELHAATGKPFAVNLWVSDHDPGGDSLSEEEFDAGLARLRPYLRELGLDDPAYPDRFGPRFDEQVEAVLDARPPVFSFVYGVPTPHVLDRCRALGIATLGTATCVEEARALDEAGVDAIVATGLEAGGHRVSFLRRAEDVLVGTLELVPQVVDAVRVPVVAAGGIADARGLVAALALGAQAVQIGTAFLACEESAAPGLHRAALFGPDAGRTALTRAFTGRLARGIRNRLMDELASAERELPPYPAQGWLVAQLRHAAVEQGRADLIALWAGQAAPLLRHRQAGELIASLVRDAARLLGRLPRTADEALGLVKGGGTDL